MPTSNRTTRLHHPQVSYLGMQIAFSVLKTFIPNYLSLHDLNFQTGFPYYPLLVFVEGSIIQAEESMEDAARAGQPHPLAQWERSRSFLWELLEDHGCAQPHIWQQLGEIEEFLGLIHKQVYLHEVTPEHLSQSLDRAASDIRLLHMILGSLLHEPFNRELFECLRPLEVLREFKWYLENYEDDLERGRYNIFFIHAKLYGDKAIPMLMERKAHYERELREGLARISPAERQALEAQLATYEKDIDIQDLPQQLAIKFRQRPL